MKLADISAQIAAEEQIRNLNAQLQERVAELEAIFGWSGGTMAALYTRAADRRRLAKGAMHKLANDQ